MAYEAIQLIADAIERAGSTGGAAIAAALRESDIEGNHRDDMCSIPEFGHAFTLPLAIMEIQNGNGELPQDQGAARGLRAVGARLTGPVTTGNDRKQKRT